MNTGIEQPSADPRPVPPAGAPRTVVVCVGAIMILGAATLMFTRLGHYALSDDEANTALFARKGALRTTPGKLGLGIPVASWVGLAATIRQSFAARAEIRDAMREIAEHERRRPDHAIRSFTRGQP